MNIKNKVFRAWGLVIFFIGALLGIILFGSMVWADLESVFYFGYGVQGVDTVELYCPPIVTAADKNPEVTAFIKNTSDRALQPLLQTDFSNILAIRSQRINVPVSAHQTVPVHMPVTTEDVVFGNLILVQVYQFSAYPLPSADANCGTLYLRLTGLNGNQVLFLVLAGTLLGMVGGLVLWAFNSRPLEGLRREQEIGMISLGVLTCLGILIGWLGWWIPGVLVFAVACLLVLVLVGRYVLAPGQP